MNREPNALIFETSPYLLQHAHNPVRWLPWGEAAFEAARTRDLPILLSVGYSACHWCHVMERESFENPEIAGLMNAHFVPVKVDREERPDVDSVYMNAVQAMTGQGGWPMTVFLTPSGAPFYGGTYFPPEDRFGRPGFKRLLHSVSEAWQQRRADILSSASELTAHLEGFMRFQGASQIDPSAPDQTMLSLERSFDPNWGGFGAAPKFPNPSNLEFLLAHQQRTGHAAALEMLELTLTRMASGGIYDHLGGGFARYSTDERWLVPHFEKMLYDNAQLITVYLQAYQVTGKPLYFVRAKESLEYALREMQSSEGGFYSAQDADSEGVEGKFFVWSESEIDATLLEEAALFKGAYGVSANGNWEGHNVLWRTQTNAELSAAFSLKPEALEGLLETARMRLFLRRESRVKPQLDDKILASWNGLMLSALALAGRCMGGRKRKYLAAAQKNAAFLREHLSFTDSSGRVRLWHSYKAGNAKIPGMLEDYSLVALGFLELFRSGFERADLDFALALTQTILELFVDPQGGFFDTPSDGEPLIVRPKSYFDSAMPSGNGATAQLLLRLSRLTNRADWQDIASDIIKQMLPAMTRQPSGFGSLNTALEHLLAPHQEIAVIGSFEREDTQALLAVLNKRYLPHSAIVAARAGDAYLPLLEARGLVGGAASAYVCQNLACQAPVTTPEALETLL